MERKVLTGPQDKLERLKILTQALEHLNVRADEFGNVYLEHRQTGSKVVFTTQGDIVIDAARDVDARTDRWYRVNSDVQKISIHFGRVLYGPRGEVLRTW